MRMNQCKHLILAGEKKGDAAILRGEPIAVVDEIAVRFFASCVQENGIPSVEVDNGGRE